MEIRIGYNKSWRKKRKPGSSANVWQKKRKYTRPMVISVIRVNFCRSLYRMRLLLKIWRSQSSNTVLSAATM